MMQYITKKPTDNIYSGISSSAGLDLNVGELLTKRPHYLEWSTDRLKKQEPKLKAEFRRRGSKKADTTDDESD